MNSFVLYTTLVCLVIAGGVDCVIRGYGGDIKNLQHHSKKYGASNSVQSLASHHSNKDENSHVQTLQDKCRLNSHGDSAFETVKKDMKEFYICLNTRNVTEILKKFHKTSTNEMYSTYEPLLVDLCNKLPDWHNCAQNYSSSIKECFDDNENLSMMAFQNASRAIESFTCQNNGQHILEFFSNGGVKCIKDRVSTSGKCLNTMKNKNYFPKPTNGQKSFSIDTLITQLKFNEEQCNDLRELQSCLVNDLKQCDQPTTANFFNSMFELALHSTPCMKFMTPRT